MAMVSRRSLIEGLALLGQAALVGCSTPKAFVADAEPLDDGVGASAELVEAARAEGHLSVIGSCEEAYLLAATDRFRQLYGIRVTAERRSTGEAQSLIESRCGAPDHDVWFGGTTDPYNIVADQGLLEPYGAARAIHVTDPAHIDAEGRWVGIYRGILGIMANETRLVARGLEVPADFADLVGEHYRGCIWMPSFETSGTAKLLMNTVIQKYGHEEGMAYLRALDANVAAYTRSGAACAKHVGPGDCSVAIGFLHDGIHQVVDEGYGTIALRVPTSGTSSEIGACAILKGAAHPQAARLWVEFALSPECVERAAESGSYQFLVIDDAEQPSQAAAFGLDPDNVMDYDFEDARAHTDERVGEVMAMIGDISGRYVNE